MTFPSLGHAISLYCRRENGILKAFIYDTSRGLTFSDSSSHEVVLAIRQFARQLNLKYKIIISSLLFFKDIQRCLIKLIV